MRLGLELVGMRYMEGVGRVYVTHINCAMRSGEADVLLRSMVWGGVDSDSFVYV